ncbi:MAG: hypothetical protein K6T88_14000 [Bacillus sp. (in: Bacteria)]|nr:hypothetical protein [Bacillus sp. (in: firmicutes)]
MSYRRNFEVLEPVNGPVSNKGVDGYTLSKHVNYVAWLIGLTLLFWLILWFWKPTWLQMKDANGQPTGQANAWLALLWGFIIALVITLIIFLLERK